jgi:hypothetical protein
MFVKILKEAGYEEALLGLSLSFYDHKIPLVDWGTFDYFNYREDTLEITRENAKDVFWTDEKYTKAQKIAMLLANRITKDNIARDNPDYIRAEQKFLRSICVWVYIQAPRCWWSEFDTYTVGMTKNSSSTMHTLDKRETAVVDYAIGTSVASINAFNEVLKLYKEKSVSISELKCNLPEGWLQERQICTNYSVLKNILNQREGHRLKYWKQFNTDILMQLEHPEFIGNINND